MSTEKKDVVQRFGLIQILFALLIAWSLFLALGSILFADSVDWRKPLIVLMTMGVFLGTWWSALKTMRRSMNK